MKITLKTATQLAKENTQVLFVQNKELAFCKSLDLDESIQKTIAATLAEVQKDAIKGCHWINTANVDILLVIDAKPKGLSQAEANRILGYNASKALQARQKSTASLVLTHADEAQIVQILEGLYFADYNFNKYKSAQPKSTNTNIGVFAESLKRADLTKIDKNLSFLFAGVSTARDLVNEPGGSLNPQDYVKFVNKLFKDNKKVKIKVRNHTQLTKEGFNGLLTVGKGSKNPPAMITLTYNPPKAKKAFHLGMVGKGVTFDTGGISLKPSDSMWEMRMDMGGSAAVLGAFQSIVALGLPIKVSAILVLAENRPGEHACLPGDIFTAKNGKTVMVENTDAEGRLILSDGLAEAGLQKCTHIVDLATLTGAVVRALGTSMTGLFSNDEHFAEKISAAGHSVGEKFWPLPLEMEYRESLDDKVADLKNIGGIAGSITAALFLNEFVPEGAVWSHWDIAGTAFTTKKWKYFEWGATGWGVRSLVALAEEYSLEK